MRVSVISGRELDPALVDRWRELQAADFDLASPYFCPEFTQTVAAVRNDVYVGVIEADGCVAGFFPFQRRAFGLGKPVGGQLSDFHGVVCGPGFAFEKDDLLRQCGLSSWKYHYLLTKQVPLSASQAGQGGSHYIDLSEGFQAYVKRLEARGSKLIKDNAYKRRKLERDAGPVRFVEHDSSPGILETLFDWKSKQYNKSGLTDVFAFDWTRELLSRIAATRTPSFSGMLSCLYAGDRLVAVHMGMRSRWSWNWWFPRHDNDFFSYSPGIMLRLFAAERAAELGLVRVDLGKGGESTYKPMLSTGAIQVSVGYAEVPGLVSAIRGCAEAMEGAIRKTPLKRILRIPGRLILAKKTKSLYL
jgi:CelD/BcsL family acetyltransferase involved in cellulose biosynthesis